MLLLDNLSIYIRVTTYCQSHTEHLNNLLVLKAHCFWHSVKQSSNVCRKKKLRKEGKGKIAEEGRKKRRKGCREKGGQEVGRGKEEGKRVKWERGKEKEKREKNKITYEKVSCKWHVAT